jgi:hypothetical protein
LIKKKWGGEGKGKRFITAMLGGLPDTLHYYGLVDIGFLDQDRNVADIVARDSATYS